MVNILIPVNKNVSPVYRYYSLFLNKISDHLFKSNINVTFVLFSDLLIDQFKSYTLINGKSSANDYISINEIENEFEFSFKQILYTDLLQTSKFVQKTRGRNWYIPDDEFIENESYKNKLNQIINLFQNNNYSFVFTDQTTDYEQSFIKYICKKYNIPFIRYLPNFMNRGFFASYSKGENGKIIDAAIDSFDKATILSFINNYKSGKESSIYNMNEKNLKLYNPYSQNNKLLWKRFYNTKLKDYFYFADRMLKDLYNKKIENRIKAFYYDKYDKNEKYIYYGLHLTTESHVGLHSHPYVNQINVIESISRALPYGFSLYVKPHPWWSHSMRLTAIKQIKQIPSVKLIHPKKSIKTIIKNSSGVITLNATTGIEALVLGKPVIAFSQVNSYTHFHPNARLCSNLYDLPRMIVKMINEKVYDEDTIDYLLKMFNNSSNIRFEGVRFLSNDDAEYKASEFSKYIRKVIKIYFDKKNFNQRN